MDASHLRKIAHMASDIAHAVTFLDDEEIKSLEISATEVILAHDLALMKGRLLHTNRGRDFLTAKVQPQGCRPTCVHFDYTDITQPPVVSVHEDVGYRENNMEPI